MSIVSVTASKTWSKDASLGRSRNTEGAKRHRKAQKVSTMQAIQVRESLSQEEAFSFGFMRSPP